MLTKTPQQNAILNKIEEDLNAAMRDVSEYGSMPILPRSHLAQAKFWHRVEASAEKTIESLFARFDPRAPKALDEAWEIIDTAIIGIQREYREKEGLGDGTTGPR